MYYAFLIAAVYIRTLHADSIYLRQRGNTDAFTGRSPLLDSLGLDWRINHRDLFVGELIGRGSYCDVFKVRFRAIDVAVKQFQLGEREEGNNNNGDATEFVNEVEILSKSHHPNVVQMIGVCIQAPHYSLVMEYLENGNLYDFIERSAAKVDMALKLQFARDIAAGMNSLHCRGIIHRDLKSSNVLVDRNFRLKVGDFGLSRLKEGDRTMTLVGSPMWTAPEVICGTRYAESADVYSYGIILWEIMTLQHPFANANLHHILAQVPLGLRPAIPPSFPKPWVELMSSCWATAPADRPSFEQILNSLDSMSSVNLIGNKLLSLMNSTRKSINLNASLGLSTAFDNLNPTSSNINANSMDSMNVSESTPIISPPDSL